MGFYESGDFEWHEPRGHVGGFSRYLVGKNNGSERLDFRLSRYETGGLVEPHSHPVAEHVYYIISGAGTGQVGSEEREVRAGTIMFVPAGVVHGVRNTGVQDLEFVVATSPPELEE